MSVIVTTSYIMEGKTCVLPILVAVLIFHACGWTSVTEARDDADIMARLAALEEGQRESRAEIRALRETVADQKDTIDKQSVKLRTLEQDIITMKASQYRQVKRLQRAERLLQSLLKAGMSGRDKVDVTSGDETSASVQSAPRRHGNVKGTFRGRRGIRAAVDGKVNMSVPKRQAPEVVAFTVFLDHDVDLGANQVIKFNQVITNEGNGYNVHTGIFTCPTGGMYLIYFAIGERDIHQQYAALMVNNQNIVDAVVEGFHTTEDAQGGNTVAIRLNQGDSLWLESMYSREHMEGSDALRITTFTGVLLN